jgi:hypothetical protein
MLRHEWSLVLYLIELLLGKGEADFVGIFLARIYQAWGSPRIITCLP